MTTKNTESSLIKEVRHNLRRGIRGDLMPEYEPTGVIEPIIIAIGEGKHEILNAQIANKCGKTCGTINSLREIFWPTNNPFFNYERYKHWPFHHKIRIVTTTTNVSDSGAIREEILKWWPINKYTCEKEGKTYYKTYKIYKTNEDKLDPTAKAWFILELMTFEQKKKEFESTLVGMTIIDEPCPPDLIGGITSRHSEGGLIVFTHTPIDAGPMLDIIDDLETGGARVLKIGGTIYENDIDTGKLNSRKTKRGLLTKEQIDDYVKKMPVDEKDARSKGIASHKSGRIYKTYNRGVHLRNIKLDSEIMKLSNLYMVMDPHRKYYPACTWWAVLPNNDLHCWNEWPYKGMFGAFFYDEIRKSKPCPLDPEQIARRIRVLDNAHNGFHIVERFMDPIFASTTGDDYSKKTEAIVLEYMNVGMNFTLPNVELISPGRERTRSLLKYDEHAPIDDRNKPRMTISPSCKNMDRCLDRHYWNEGKETEAERYKDFCDTVRILTAGLGKIEHDPAKASINIVNKKKDEHVEPHTFYDEYGEIMRDIELG